VLFKGVSRGISQGLTRGLNQEYSSASTGL
jgi:hypothetical protein